MDPEEILHKVARLPVNLWNFKADQSELRHLGPMAQDFFAAFGLGGSDRTINLLDASGVALAAIQGLRRKLDDENARLRDQLSGQQKEIDSLRREMTELRALLESAIKPVTLRRLEMEPKTSETPGYRSHWSGERRGVLQRCCTTRGLGG